MFAVGGYKGKERQQRILSSDRSGHERTFQPSLLLSPSFFLFPHTLHPFLCLYFHPALHPISSLRRQVQNGVSDRISDPFHEFHVLGGEEATIVTKLVITGAHVSPVGTHVRDQDC